ncbi:MAG TPA: hypothetical protein DD490_28320 [Acidobacteria bacterium]|nr:hypothetical protein [Acidobacteriota bacterium]
MRLYGQGLGDCFLLAFPRRGKPKDPCYLVIDCGAAISTPDKDERIRRVVEDIHAATGGHIDALAITHQHYDHISGFQDAWLEWQKITVDAVYLPWTERAAEAGDHKGTKAFREALERAAMKALEEAARAGLLDQPGFRAQADFLGVAIRGEAEAATVQPTDMDGAMAFARGLCPPENIRYFEPGDVFRLPGTEAHGYVLGPPLKDKANEKGKRYIELLVDEKEMYSYGPLGLKVDDGLPGGDKAFALSDDHSLPALASALRVAGAVDRAGDEGFSPFPPEVRLDWDLATGSPFFKNHYGEAKDSIGNGAFRRIDFDWLGQAAQLALRAGDFTNNVSLVLAFDHPKSDKMLLFPGDAQVGNWLSWHTIKEWRLCEGADPARPPAPTEKQTLMENLLSRIAFYKVGHHGSHNATIKDKGLEAMTRPDLVAYVPVSIPVAQDLMGYCPMPFYPVLRALHRKTQGRVFFPNGRPLISRRDGPEKSPETLQEEARIKPSSEMLKEKKDKNGTVLEGPVPLYLEMTVGA